MRGAASVVARVALVTALWSASAAAADSVRVLVSIASNAGDPEDVPLRFAQDDAERVRSLLVDIGGVAPERAYLVLDQRAAAVRETLREVSGRIAELTAAGKEVVLIVYVSAHARGGVLHLAGTHMPLSELREYIGKSAANLRVVVVDACDSGTIARSKGGVPGPEYQVALEQVPLSGQVLISSSGPAEVSQEFDALSGSLFTHHLLTGLRGDADTDGNGTVTLGEAYSYAYRRTVVQAEGTGQHPAFDFDVHGSGDLVLSQPGAARSVLVFAEGLSGHFLVASQPRPDIVAEVEKQRGKVLRLAVAPGRYLIRKPTGRRVGLLTLELPYGGQQMVDERAMVFRDYLEVGSKGGYVDPRPSSIVALGGFDSAPLTGTGGRWRAGVGYRHAVGDFWFLGSAAVGAAHYRGIALTTTEKSATLSLAAGYRWLSLPVIPMVGVGVEALGLMQSYRRDDEQLIERVFGQPSIPRHGTMGVSFGPMVGLEFPLPARLFALVFARVPLRYLPATGQPALSVGVDSVVALGWHL